jgi:hypothetical protein
MNEYPVVRKNSLIGGTNRDICELLVGRYVRCYTIWQYWDCFGPIMDLWALSEWVITAIC